MIWFPSFKSYEYLTNLLLTTSQRTVEAEARENERRYREVQLELAHASRVATMGQLTASITHEVNQPITAAVTCALAAQRGPTEFSRGG